MAEVENSKDLISVLWSGLMTSTYNLARMNMFLTIIQGGGTVKRDESDRNILYGIIKEKVDFYQQRISPL